MLPREKLEALARRYQEIDLALCEPEVLADYQKMQKLNKERSDIEPVVRAQEKLMKAAARLQEDKAALSDPDLRELVEGEIPVLESEIAALEDEIRRMLLPADPNDKRNTIVEVRGGEGGEEAALFAADLFRMYLRFAEARKWKVEIMSLSEASAGGTKEVIALFSGQDVYSKLRYEAGVHRVQRVPVTEAQGRIHTSTATVVVLPEAEDVEVQIEDKDLRFDIAASGGPGGQGVNTTNSAVQITHLPTGMIVKCQDERSQIKNKAKALKVLKSRLLDLECQKREAATTAERRGMVGTGERAQKVRTYNFPQNRVTDHRIGLTLHKLDRIMEGDLDELITALRNSHQAEMLGGAGDPAHVADRRMEDA
ncbi:MAG: peptide chain release factor 1 [Deltaproteobacteria bacterium]|nr:peptide chain release factor 1 [Deltaproteobacteria bacterium]